MHLAQAGKQSASCTWSLNLVPAWNTEDVPGLWTAKCSQTVVYKAMSNMQERGHKPTLLQEIQTLGVCWTALASTPALRHIIKKRWKQRFVWLQFWSQRLQNAIKKYLLEECFFIFFKMIVKTNDLSLLPTISDTRWYKFILEYWT